MNKTGIILNVIIIITAIGAMMNGSFGFIVGHPGIPLFMSIFFIMIYLPSWAIKNRMFPYIYRPGLNIKVLLIASCSWLIFTVLEAMANGANIRVDLLITLPAIIIITSTCLIIWASSFLHVSHNKAN